MKYFIWLITAQKYASKKNQTIIGELKNLFLG